MHACELKDYVCLPLCQVRTSPYILCSSCQTAIIQVKISADKATSHTPLQTGELELSNARVLVTQTHTLSLLVDLTWASKVSEHLDPEIIITMCSAFPCLRLRSHLVKSLMCLSSVIPVLKMHPSFSSAVVYHSPTASIDRSMHGWQLQPPRLAWQLLCYQCS